MKRAIILTLLGVLASTTVIAGDIRMWRDENGKVHFGDSPPPQSESRRVVTSPQNSYSGGQNFQHRLDRMTRSRQQRIQHEINTYDPDAERVTTDEEDRRLRELRMEKDNLREELRKDRGHKWSARDYAIGRDIEGVNRQVRDIENQGLRDTTDEEDRRLRELGLEKDNLRDERKRTNEPFWTGKDYAISRDVDGVNQQIRDINNRQ